ncbi:MAG TPA: permease-like cell division protein FtsX [Gammaproteobacteria bacterium]|nr:permease-like cell division protein FtsX [Gammaproteobacteria bacterium]
MEQRTSKPEFGTRLSAWGVNHLHVFFSSLGRIWRAPVASLMTVSVLAIALALPAGFYLLLRNAQQISGGWDGVPRISLYLKTDTSPQNVDRLAEKLRQWKDVTDIKVLHKDQALQEFKMLSGFGEALDALDENPLPPVIVIAPRYDAAEPGKVEALLEKLRALPEADIVQLDLQWVKRLYTIMSLVQRGLYIIAAMLGLAVILIIGNTIRLDIQNRRSEIQVNKLIGATDAFIRRPFLYTGFWYGLLGGLVASLLVALAFALLQGPSKRLAGLYESGFQLTALGFGNTLALIGLAIALGYAGAWLAVGRHLREIEPG